MRRARPAPVRHQEGDLMVAENIAPLFSVSSRREYRWSVVDVAGEVDLATAPALRDCLMEVASVHDRPPSVIVDLSDVRFCDASGLGVLVDAHKRIQRRGGRLRLICPEGQVLRLIRITGLTRLLPIYPALDDARRDGDDHKGRIGRRVRTWPPASGRTRR